MKIENLLPKVYYKESRDFAYIGRAFEIIVNYIKSLTDVISINYNSTNISDMLVELYALNIGLRNISNYNLQELQTWVNNYSYMLKYKGSLKSIDLAVKIWLNFNKLTTYSLDVNNQNLIIYIPTNIGNTKLLEYMFNYILPAGMTYNIVTADKQSLYLSTYNKNDISDYKINLSDYDLGNVFNLDNVGSDTGNLEDVVKNINIADDSFNTNSTFYLGTIVNTSSTSISVVSDETDLNNIDLLEDVYM